MSATRLRSLSKREEGRWGKVPRPCMPQLGSVRSSSAAWTQAGRTAAKAPLKPKTNCAGTPSACAPDGRLLSPSSRLPPSQ